MTEKTKGHGYFRKKKWAKGLVSGIAVAGIVAFSAGSVLADEAVQPESKNDNNAYAKQAGKTTGSQSVAIDSTEVTKATEKAKKAGVVVSETPSVDKGTDTNSSSLEQSKSEIKQLVLNNLSLRLSKIRTSRSRSLKLQLQNKFKIMRPSKKRMKLFTLTINL